MSAAPERSKDQVWREGVGCERVEQNDAAIKATLNPLSQAGTATGEPEMLTILKDILIFLFSTVFFFLFGCCQYGLIRVNQIKSNVKSKREIKFHVRLS